MKQVSALMRWVGPVAIVGATFAMISDQLGLVVHLPEAGADTMGYHAVGSGLFLFVLTLLLVGMIGLYAGREGIRWPVRVPSGGARWMSLQLAKRRREEVETKTTKEGKTWLKQATS